MHVVLRRRTYLTSFSRCSIAGIPINALHIRDLLGIFRKTSFRPFSNDMSLTRHIKPAKILKAYNGQKKALHPPLMKALASIQRVLVKLSTMVDSSLQGSLAGGGFSSVWLARDRKYVLETVPMYPRFTSKIKR
jgi:hypothetical protein